MQIVKLLVVKIFERLNNFSDLFGLSSAIGVFDCSFEFLTLFFFLVALVDDSEVFIVALLSSTQQFFVFS